MPRREDVYDVAIQHKSLAHADIARELGRRLSVRSSRLDHTTQMTALTGEPPSYRFVNDVLYVSHDCRTQRLSALVNTTDSFGWVILRREPSLLLNRPVSCSGCHNLRTAHFVAEVAQ